MQVRTWMGLLAVSAAVAAWVLTGSESGVESDRVEAPAAASTAGTGFIDQLVSADGAAVQADALSGKVIGLYFSAKRCPPCRAFTPSLVEAYEALQAEGKPFEVVFVSADRDEAAMFDYMRSYKMNWLAIPFADAARESLQRRYQIRGYPTLVIVDDQGAVITADGRRDIAMSGAAAFDGWSN